MYQLDLSKKEFKALQDLLANDICKNLSKSTKIYKRIFDKTLKCKLINVRLEFDDKGFFEDEY